MTGVVRGSYRPVWKMGRVENKNTVNSRGYNSLYKPKKLFKQLLFLCI